MTEVLTEAITQWGMAGLAVVAAGYIIWSNHKDAKKTKEKYENLYDERVKHLEEKYEEKGRTSKSIQDSTKAINELSDKIDNITCAQEGCHTVLVEMDEKINHLDGRVDALDKKVNSDAADGANHLQKMTMVAPTIHTLIQNNMEEMKADHVFVALLHNGMTGITGIPFLKMKTVIEKYNPIDNLNDICYAERYNGEEIMIHDKLPGTILQNDLVDIVVNEDGTSTMDQLDMISAREMRKIGTKRIMIKSIRDMHGVPMGFVVAYSYKTRDMDLELFEETVQTIERMYRDVCS